MTSELCNIMSKLGEKNNFKMILSLIYSSIKKKIEIYNKNKTYINLSIIKNYIIFFMILFINVKQSGLFIETVFDEGTNFFQSLIGLINQITDKNEQQNLFGLLNNIFLSDYKSLYFKKNSSEKDEKLEQIFIHNQIYYSTIYNKAGTIYGDSTYMKMFNILSSFDLSYDNFFMNKTQIKPEDKINYIFHKKSDKKRHGRSKKKIRR